ncbi:hypothetical protein [Sporosarcina sp. USHLN248]|uniref:hypothetical protein n=1 Tax=Sporosarcina sp. USHLN248 TaxID=3081300 RepID=UPI0030180ADF
MKIFELIEQQRNQNKEILMQQVNKVEEVGEVAQAIQQGSVASKDTDADDLYTELIHVAAVASAFAEQVQEERKGDWAM